MVMLTHVQCYLITKQVSTKRKDGSESLFEAAHHTKAYTMTHDKCQKIENDTTPVFLEMIMLMYVLRYMKLI